MSSKSKLILSSLTTMGLLGAGVVTSTVLNTGDERGSILPNVLDVRADDDHRDESELLVSEKTLTNIVQQLGVDSNKEAPTVVPSTESKLSDEVNPVIADVIFTRSADSTLSSTPVKKSLAVATIDLSKVRDIKHVIEPTIVDDADEKDADKPETESVEDKKATSDATVKLDTNVVNLVNATMQTPTVNVTVETPLTSIIGSQFVDTPAAILEEPIVETPIAPVEEFVAVTEPVVETPVEPVLEELVIETPVAPTIEEPVVEVVEEAVVETPAEIVVEPVAETPVEPIVEEPIVEPVVEPIIETPVEPAVETPVEPVVEAPVEPVVEAPVEPVYVAPTEPNTYPIGQCTWGVKEVAPWVGNWWGNAKDWGASATNAGFTTGTTPQVGAVIVFPNTMYQGEVYGHVGYVTAVHGDGTIEILESNYNGNMTVGNYRGAFDPSSPWWGGGVYYIYP